MSKFPSIDEIKQEYADQGIKLDPLKLGYQYISDQGTRYKIPALNTESKSELMQFIGIMRKLYGDQHADTNDNN